MSGLLARCKPAALLYNLIITIYQDQDARQLDRVGKPGQTDGPDRRLLQGPGGCLHQGRECGCSPAVPRSGGVDEGMRGK